jgi:uncharacterized membrane protein
MIIPLIMFISIVAIVYNMYKERYNRRQKQQEKEAERMRSIERIVLKTVREKAEYWDNFNIALYVEYLERTQ